MKTLMYAEDDPLLRSVFIRKFQQQTDFKILQAEDGQAAIVLMDQMQPDLLVTGINMPRVDGFGVLEHIRAKGYKFPVIFLDNLDEEDVRKRAYDLGVSAYLVNKDTTYKHLIEVVQKFLPSEKAEIVRENSFKK